MGTFQHFVVKKKKWLPECDWPGKYATCGRIHFFIVSNLSKINTMKIKKLHCLIFQSKEVLLSCLERSIFIIVNREFFSPVTNVWASSSPGDRKIGGLVRDGQRKRGKGWWDEDSKRQRNRARVGGGRKWELPAVPLSPRQSHFSSGEWGNNGSGGISGSMTLNDAGHGEGRKNQDEQSMLAHRRDGSPPNGEENKSMTKTPITSSVNSRGKRAQAKTHAPNHNCHYKQKPHRPPIRTTKQNQPPGN